MYFLQSPPDWSAFVLLSLRLGISVFVTADILLRKSDVRAAFGWIAAVWLSPIVGGLLYYFFGINRVTRRAVKLSRKRPKSSRADSMAPSGLAPAIGELARISQRITAAPLSNGNDVGILHGGDEAYPAMLEAISRAERSIALSSYIFRNDSVGRSFMDALIAAHQRGVTVRVLLDSIGAGYFFPASIRKLTNAGIAAAQFLHTWIPWRMPFLNMRNHRKLLICDGKIGFTGGMNIGTEYSASLSGKDQVRDIHFRLEGPIVHQLMHAFAQDWCYTTAEDLDGDLWWPALEARGEIAARGIRCGPDGDIYKTETLLGAALGQAKRRVRIVTPYFLPSQNLQFAIREALLRDVTVDIVIPAECDYRLMDWAMRGHLRAFRHIPANIHISPPPFDHAKLVTVDDEWCLFGSSNWDVRSHRLNFEFDVECYDAALATALDKVIDVRIAKAGKFNPETILSWPKPVQIRNAAAHLLLPYL